MTNPTISLLIVHNVMWSDYKASVFNELSRLQTPNFQVRVIQIALTSRERQTLGDPDLAHHRYEYSLLFDNAFEEVWAGRMIISLIREVRKSDASIVVLPGYERFAYWVLLCYCVLTNRRRILTLDSTKFDHEQLPYKVFLKRLFVRFCAGALCYGTRSREYLQFLGMDPKKITIRCQAAATDVLLSAGAKRANWNENNAGEELTYLYVGRLSLEKDLECLIRAFTEALQTNDGMRLSIVGDGPIRAELVKFARQQSASRKIDFLGPKSKQELAAIYASAYCLVLPSLSEPWGLVVNEAMLFGCPAIVSDRCGCAVDLITNGKTGFVFASGDHIQLSDCIQKMNSMRLVRNEIGDACVDLISHFTPQVSARQFRDAVIAFSQ